MNYIDHDDYWKAYNPQLGDQVFLNEGIIFYDGLSNGLDRWAKVTKTVDKDGDIVVYFNCMYWGVDVHDVSKLIPAS